MAKESNSEELFLTDLSLKELPPSIKFLKNIKTAYFIGNNFKRLPIEICELVNLEKLYISDCGIEEIPEEFGNLSNLSLLDLKNNELKKLPESFSKLSNLKTLHLNNNKFEVFPESILQLKLTSLIFKDNQLAVLPNAINNISTLETLDLNKNKLESVPSSLGEISMLKKLDLSQNSLTTLPQSFTNLINLDSNNQKFSWNKGFNIEGNKFSLNAEDYLLEPIGLISKILKQNKPKLQNEINLFSKHQNTFSETISGEVNIIAFGENKFQVIEILENLFDFNEDYSIASAIIFDKKINFNFINFGSLGLSEVSQKIFDLPNTIKMVVVDKLEDFLLFHNLNKTPSLFISNKKIKEVDSSFNYISLKSIFKLPSIFENNIQDCILKLNTKKSSIELDNLCEQLNNIEELFIDKEKFNSILLDFGLESKIEQVAALKKMQQKNLVYTFKNQASFEEFYVANKYKLLMQINELFKSNFLSVNHGIINYNDFPKVFNSRSLQPLTSNLLNIFLQEKWAFKTNHNQLIFPSFLGENNANSIYSNKSIYILNYQFKFSSNKIFHLLLAKLHADFFINKLCKDFIEVEIIDSLVSLSIVNDKEWVVNIIGGKFVAANKFISIYLETFFNQNKCIFDASQQCICTECVKSLSPYSFKKEQIIKRKLLNYYHISCPQSMLDIDINLLID